VIAQKKLAHDKTSYFRLGFMPAKFLRLTLIRGTPMSLYYIQPMGLPLQSVSENFGLDFARLLVPSALRDLQDPVIPPEVRVPSWHHGVSCPFRIVAKSQVLTKAPSPAVVKGQIFMKANSAVHVPIARKAEAAGKGENPMRFGIVLPKFQEMAEWLPLDGRAPVVLDCYPSRVKKKRGSNSTTTTSNNSSSTAPDPQ